MTDYGSFVPEALKTSQNPTLATLGERLYLDTSLELDLPYRNLIYKVLDGTHALIVTVDYLIYIQHKRGLTHSTYIMEDKVSLVRPGIHEIFQYLCIHN